MTCVDYKSVVLCLQIGDWFGISLWVILGMETEAWSLTVDL